VTASDRAVAHRAAARARDAGAGIAIAEASDRPREGDVVIALEWPPTGAAPGAALRAMASGLATIVFETESVGDWPTLDPQTWQPRGYLGDAAPIAISIDPRDEEHSLMLAMRRLATAGDLGAGLGAAAAAWTREHASLERAVHAWRDVLLEATQLAPAIDHRELPAHLTADGTERARALLGEMGVAVDFLPPRW
jgi:hypothetical protein